MKCEGVSRQENGEIKFNFRKLFNEVGCVCIADERGRIISRSSYDNSYTILYKYDDNDNCIEEIHPHCTIFSDFDEKKQVIHRKWGNPEVGFLEWWKDYDRHGNVIKYKHTNGDWFNAKYSHDGQKIEFESNNYVLTPHIHKTAAELIMECENASNLIKDVKTTEENNGKRKKRSFRTK